MLREKKNLHGHSNIWPLTNNETDLDKDQMGKEQLNLCGGNKRDVWLQIDEAKPFQKGGSKGGGATQAPEKPSCSDKKTSIKWTWI